MKYINEKTGAVLETECEIFGGDWEEESKRKDDDKPADSDVKDTKGKEK